MNCLSKELPPATDEAMNHPAHACETPAPKHAVQILRDLNSTAKALGVIAAELPLFYHRGNVVFYDHREKLQVMTGMDFRNWINHQGVMTFSKFDDDGAPVPCSLSCGDAAAILKAGSFLMGLKPLVKPYDEGGFCDQ